MAVIVGMTVFVADEIVHRFRHRWQPKTLGSIFVRHPNAIAAVVAVVLAARFLPGGNPDRRPQGTRHGSH